MASFNRVILIGNITRDIELRHLASGTAVADIGMAVNDRIKRGDEWVDEVTFVDVTLFGRMAEVANEYLTKGSPLFIEGRLKFEQWEKDGQKRSKLKVIGEKLQMIGGKQDRQESTPAEPRPPRRPTIPADPVYEIEGDDIPF